LIYGVVDDYPQVIRSTLHLYSSSALTAIVEGSIFLQSGLELRILEVLDFKIGRIRQYSYTVFRGGERVRWYDSQPHPEIPDLSETFPHHRHEPPDIKHNRRPAPGISFSSSNVPVLLADCSMLAESVTRD
jgi:hypothetical protein